MAVGMGGSSPPWVLLCKDMVVKKARGHPSASSILVRIPLGWEARPQSSSSFPHPTWPDPRGKQHPCKIFLRLFKHKAKHQKIRFPAQDAGPPITALGKQG